MAPLNFHNLIARAEARTLNFFRRGQYDSHAENIFLSTSSTFSKFEKKYITFKAMSIFSFFEPHSVFT